MTDKSKTRAHRAGNRKKMTEEQIATAMSENAVHLATVAAHRAAEIHTMVERADNSIPIRDTLVDLIASVVMTVAGHYLAEDDGGIGLINDILRMIELRADEDDEETLER